MPTHHTIPDFAQDSGVSAEAYENWLEKKARSLKKRDRKRGMEGVKRSTYKEAIHAAVLVSKGFDAYTGEPLDWHLLSQYSNEDSKAGKYAYKAKFSLLPTVDHVDASATEASFKICGWRTNDAKHDLSYEAFLELCKKVISQSERGGS